MGGGFLPYFLLSLLPLFIRVDSRPFAVPKNRLEGLRHRESGESCGSLFLNEEGRNFRKRVEGMSSSLPAFLIHLSSTRAGWLGNDRSAFVGARVARLVVFFAGQLIQEVAGQAKLIGILPGMALLSGRAIGRLHRFGSWCRLDLLRRGRHDRGRLGHRGSRGWRDDWRSGHGFHRYRGRERQATAFRDRTSKRGAGRRATVFAQFEGRARGQDQQGCEGEEGKTAIHGMERETRNAGVD